MIGSLPKLASPRSNAGQQSRAVRSSSAHRPGAAHCRRARRHRGRAAGPLANRCDNNGSVGQASWGCNPTPLLDGPRAASPSYPFREFTARPEAAPCNHRDDAAATRRPPLPQSPRRRLHAQKLRQPEPAQPEEAQPEKTATKQHRGFPPGVSGIASVELTQRT